MANELLQIKEKNIPVPGKNNLGELIDTSRLMTILFENQVHTAVMNEIQCHKCSLVTDCHGNCFGISNILRSFSFELKE